MDSYSVDEIQKIIYDLTKANNEMKQTVGTLKNDNELYKKKHKNLQQHLNELMNLLEENAKLHQNLFVDAKCALQMGTVSMHLTPHRSTEVGIPKEDQEPPNLSVCPSQMNETYQEKNLSLPRLQRQTLVFREYEQNNEDFVDAGDEENSNNISRLSRLSTIPEENSKMLSLCKGVSVQLTRLPQDIATQLSKHNSTVGSYNSSTKDHDSLFSKGNLTEPGCSSTPLPDKRVTISPPTAENSPVCPIMSYVNTRRKAQRNGVEIPQNLRDLENVSPQTGSTSSLNEVFSKNCPSPPSRPKRRGRPASLKEKSLRSKLRRM